MMTYKMDSSAINQIAYDPETKVLKVTFQSGGTYDYFGVPQKVVKDWLAAESAGRYFHKHVKQYSSNNF